MNMKFIILYIFFSTKCITSLPILPSLQAFKPIFPLGGSSSSISADPPTENQITYTKKTTTTQIPTVHLTSLPHQPGMLPFPLQLLPLPFPLPLLLDLPQLARPDGSLLKNGDNEENLKLTSAGNKYMNSKTN